MSAGAGHRVVILSIGLGRGGGAELQIVRLACDLRRRGWEVRVVTLLRPAAWIGELAAAGVPVTWLGVRGRAPDPRPFVRLVALLRRVRPHALVTFMFHANVVGRLMGRLAGVPVVVSSVRAENFGGALRYWLVSATDRLADATTANSRHVADDLVRRGVVRPGGIHVTLNAFTVPERAPPAAEVAAARGALGVDPDDFLWLAVGSPGWHKDYPTLLRASRILARDGWAGKLRIAGQGPDNAALVAMAAELGVAGRVEFLGFRGDVPLLVHAADGFVSSSVSEGMPNAIAEAMAAGKPVVATRVGGTPELVEDGTSGFLVPPGDPVALAGAMRRVMEMEPERRAAMGAAGRAFVASAHQPRRVADHWESLLLELVRGKRRTG